MPLYSSGVTSDLSWVRISYVEPRKIIFKASSLSPLASQIGKYRNSYCSDWRMVRRDNLYLNFRMKLALAYLHPYTPVMLSFCLEQPFTMIMNFQVLFLFIMFKFGLGGRSGVTTVMCYLELGKWVFLGDSLFSTYVYWWSWSCWRYVAILGAC